MGFGDDVPSLAESFFGLGLGASANDAATSAKNSMLHSAARDFLMLDDLASLPGNIFHPLNPAVTRPNAYRPESYRPRSQHIGSQSMNLGMGMGNQHPSMNHFGMPRTRRGQQNNRRDADMSRRSGNRSGMGSRKVPEHRICRFFSNGYCNRGSGCNWAHVNIVPTRCSSFPETQQLGAARPLPLGELRGNVYLLARQQEGCRMLQRYLEQENAIDIIWREAISNVGPLITDPFGHYLWLRLLDRITTAQRLELLRSLSNDMVGISLNVHGTRVIQKLLEKVKSDEEIEAAVSALRGEVSTLSKDVYGMHVVLRCLYHPKIDNAFIINAVSKRIVPVSMHKHGCCVVQWCLDYGTTSQREGLIDEIARNALELVQDAYGNYVIQQIMDVSKWKSHEDAVARRKVMEALLGSIAKLAVQKFSSIVVEKCLQEADDDIRRAMVEELVDPARLPRLLQDPYANYVIQKVLSVSRTNEFHRLIVRIRPHLDVLSATPFGKRIQLQMFRKFPILSINQVQVPAPTFPHHMHKSAMPNPMNEAFYTRALE